MSITLLYGCCQIETSARDLAAVRRFMMEVLGANPIEQVLAKQIAALIPGVGYDVDHLDCGEAVFQINQPSPDMVFKGQKSVHQAYLERVGPSVTNLNYFIDDYRHAHELLTSMGAQTHIRGPSTAARVLADYGPENTRPGGEDRPFLFMSSRHLIGLDLEIMEPNFLHFSQQAVQYPAFIHPRPAVGHGNLRLKRLQIAVADLEQTHDNLLAIFAPASRSKPYSIQSGRHGRSFRIGLGGMEVEYCQPNSPDCELGKFLAQLGPGVFSAVFEAHDPAMVLEKCRAHGGIEVQDTSDLLGLAPQTPSPRIASRALIGFDAVLEQCEQTSL
ncbi:MAG: hypothetical protein ABIM50_06660 [Novosphingobium sp.]